ncbi:MAG TPA: GMC family oxidoreductase [Solirubrobacterales bacterium]|nr:GMC family oxidoreductase [Solirubrobacterales bacterium]
MAPGVGALPAAEREVPVVEPLVRYLEALPPSAIRQIRLALRVFEWLPFPWRFSRASLEAREQFLREMDGSRFSRFQDLLLFMKVLAGMGYGRHPRVRDAIGYSMRCEVAEGEPPAPDPGPSPLGDLEPPEEGEECDVAIIGSGAGGAVAATILAEAGLDVVVLEAGPYLDRRTYPSDPLEALTTLYRDGGLTVAQGKPSIPVPIGRAVGGTTVINSGTCFRAPQSTLQGWREDFGVEWATELDADYAEAEEMLRVTPVDTERMGRNGQLVMEGAAALGASGGPISRNAGRCVGCSSCPAGCRLDAKRAMHVSYLPRAVAAGARVRAGVAARAVRFENGRAAGLSCATAADDGAAGYELRARSAVVLSGGAVGTPELLLRSGVHGGQIGRNLRIHPACWIGARFDEEVRGWDGVMQSYYVDEWEEMGLLMEATFTPLAFGAQWLPGTGREHQERILAYDRVGSNGVHLSDHSTGRVGLTSGGEVRVTYRLERDDARKLVFGIARAAEIFFAAGAREVYSQVRGMPVLKPGQVADFEAASPLGPALRLEAFHPMGTARMSADPGAGVTAPDGSIHGTEALYVADASLFPTSIGVNPMMTVIACSSRISRRLAERIAG